MDRHPRDGQGGLGGFADVLTELLANSEVIHGRSVQAGEREPQNYSVVTAHHPSQPSSTRRSATQCRTMAVDMVKQYIALISQFFRLSDMAVRSPSAEKSGTPTHRAGKYTPC